MCVHQGTRAHTSGTRQLLHNFDYKQQQEKKNKCTIYISGLAADLAESELRLVFSPFGDIKTIEVPRHEDNNKVKGFAFVEYAQEEAAVSNTPTPLFYLTNSIPTYLPS